MRSRWQAIDLNLHVYQLVQEALVVGGVQESVDPLHLFSRPRHGDLRGRERLDMEGRARVRFDELPYVPDDIFDLGFGRPTLQEVGVPIQ